jgi:hypothetical protein
MPAEVVLEGSQVERRRVGEKVMKPVHVEDEF